MNYYRRYVGDYLRDTARLSMLEHGAYTLLLDYCYADEQPLPLDKLELYTMVRAMTPADRNAVDRILAKFFSLEDDGYHQKRVDHEIAVSKQARVNGKKGGRGGTGGPTGSETGLLTGCDTGTETDCETGVETEEAPGTVHPPTTNHQPPASNRQPPTKTKPGKVVGKPKINGDFHLPEWVPEDVWCEYLQMRVKQRKPASLRAKRMAVGKLQELREQGYNPREVLCSSIFNCYQGLFPPKG